MVIGVIERHPAIVSENQTDDCLPCQNGTAQNPETRRRRKGLDAPPPRQAPSQPGTPAVPSDDTQSSETEAVSPGSVNICTALPRLQCFNLDPYANDRMGEIHFVPTLLTDDGASTGYYTIS
jgi:hypothetical protein